MTVYRPGQVIKFTYRHFWPPDQNTRDEHKEILVLHTRWGNKVHGVDMKVLNPLQLEILRVVMDPKNNKGQGQETNDEVKSPPRTSDSKKQLDQLKNALKSLENRMHLISAQSSARNVPVSKNVIIAYNQEKQNLKNLIVNWVEQDAAPEPAQKVEKKQIPPQAKQILMRMKPARLVNNPRIFYNMFIKPFLFGIDAYRTFFPGRMNAIQVDPRWSWIENPEVNQTPAQQKTPPPPPKYAGAPREATPAEQARSHVVPGLYAAGSSPPISGVHALPPGAAEGGVLGRPAGVRVNKRGIQVPTTSNNIKAPRNK